MTHARKHFPAPTQLQFTADETLFLTINPLILTSKVRILAASRLRSLFNTWVCDGGLYMGQMRMTPGLIGTRAFRMKLHLVGSCRICFCRRRGLACSVSTISIKTRLLGRTPRAKIGSRVSIYVVYDSELMRSLRRSSCMFYPFLRKLSLSFPKDGRKVVTSIRYIQQNFGVNNELMRYSTRRTCGAKTVSSD